MDRDAIKDRIRKLLNLAGNDAASEVAIVNGPVLGPPWRVTRAMVDAAT